MEKQLWYLIKDDEAFFYLEYLYANKRIYMREMKNDALLVLERLVGDRLVYENYFKRGLHIIKYYMISDRGKDAYEMIQAVRECFLER